MRDSKKSPRYMQIREGNLNRLHQQAYRAVMQAERSEGACRVMKSPQNLEAQDTLARFANELSAHQYLEKLLWPNGCVCRRCGVSGRIGKLNGASTRIGTYKCYACRKSFSVTLGTLFESSHVPVHKWLQAMYLTDCGARPIRPHHL